LLNDTVLRLLLLLLCLIVVQNAEELQPSGVFPPAAKQTDSAEENVTIRL
jgi:hypothetical protein